MKDSPLAEMIQMKTFNTMHKAPHLSRNLKRKSTHITDTIMDLRSILKLPVRKENDMPLNTKEQTKIVRRVAFDPAPDIVFVKSYKSYNFMGSDADKGNCCKCVVF